ncbi:MAG: hypothetical protein NW220_08070 [Leptolyngbyaceae cyanobacterium bins.349]|nr:hypothetical protein [Leptolyngbyaceae cyanobacterium bins.349]
MKNLTSIKIAVVGALSLAIAAPFTSTVQAQALVGDLADRARESCVNRAAERGFQLKEVVSVVGTTDGGAKVVLLLTRQGSEARLTCDLSKDGSVVLGDEPGTTATTVAPTTEATATPNYGPLAWLLLPLLGLPLLYWWTKGRDRMVVASAENAVSNYAGEAVVQTNDATLPIYSGPGTNYRITSTLRNGQHVNVTGRYQDGWAELTQGGWVLASSIGVLSHQH